MNTAISRHFLAALGFIALAAPAIGAQSTVTAQIEPQSIALGESARLIVTIKGSEAAPPKVPDVDGLEIVSVGQQSSMQMINGNVSASVAHIYQVTPNLAGRFTIPAIAAAGADSAQPIVLNVGKGAGGQTQRTPSQRHSQLPAPSVGPADNAAVDTKGQSAFLRVVLPKQELTVGELVPVQVKAYFRAGVSATLNGLPVLSSDAFTLNKLGDHPEQTRESVDGVSYTVVTWTSALSAVKAGDYPLNLDLPVMVRMKGHTPRRGGGRSPLSSLFGGGDPFSDSFFDDFFGGMTEKPLTLHTDGSVMKIKALPVEGRPSDFSGAVGSFDLSSEATVAGGANVTKGDPLTLTIKITGKGNFDRVTTKGLSASAEWKSYKPSARFEPADRSNTSGSKIFEQSIVPTKAGAQEIPALRFSYFDPGTQSYVTKAALPLAIDVVEGSAPAQGLPKLANAGTAEGPKSNADGLAPDKVVAGHGTASLRPLILTPWFVGLNGMLVVVLAVAGVIRAVRARRKSDPGRLQREAAKKVLNDRLAAMDQALAAEDTQRFFDSARRVLQEHLAEQWQLPASSVTIPEIRARLNGHGKEVSAIFEAADEIAYSGKRFTAPDLRLWRDLVKNQLHQVDQP